MIWRWCEIEYVGNDTYRLWIRWWHPGFWMEAFRVLKATGMSTPAAVYYTAVFAGVLVRRKR